MLEDFAASDACPQWSGGPFLMRCLLLVLSLFALASHTTLVVAGQEEAPADLPKLSPEIQISFNYPSSNPWVLNSLVAFTPDGRYLIDAASRGRYIQVWDWKKNKVVKRLLLNENAPEIETKADMRKQALATPGEPGWAFSPDGKYFAVCTNMVEPAGSGVITVRVWNVEQGTVVGNIKTIQQNIPGIGSEDALVHAGCKSILFSPDGKRMLMTTQSYGGFVYANRDKLIAQQADGRVYAILYDTDSWQPTAALHNPDLLEDAVSPGLYDRDGGKTILMLLRQNPHTIAITAAIEEKLGKETGHNIQPEDRDPYVQKRLVAFDADTGQIVKSTILPEMKLRMLDGDGVQGIKWSWLGESGKEVYWNLDSETEYDSRFLFVSDSEAHRCDKLDVLPGFYSEVIEDCGTLWKTAVLNVETGKTRFMAPIKKRRWGDYDKWNIVSAKSYVLSDGKRLVLTTWLVHTTSKKNWMGVPVTKGEGKAALYSFPETRLLGWFVDGASTRVRLSRNSRYMVSPNTSEGKAAIYDLSRITQAQ